jgi:hypothetical protein
MNTIEFDSVVEDGVIHVPERYRSSTGSAVRVTMISTSALGTEDGMESVNSLLGIIPDDFDLNETRLERITGTHPGK